MSGWGNVQVTKKVSVHDMPNISENSDYQHLVKATMQAKRDQIAFDPFSFDATTTTTPSTSGSHPTQFFDLDMEEEGDIEREFSGSLKRGTQAARLARPESSAIVKKPKGGQNVQ
jgi:hypothetical protein